MRRLSRSSKPLAVIVVALFLAACRGSAGVVPPPPQPPSALRTGQSAGKIKHIIIIVQENRSFNNLFYGYPGAKTASYGYDKNGNKIALKPVTLATSWDLQHNAKGFLAACNGTGKTPGTQCRMNGFDDETWTCTMKKSPTSGGDRDPAAGQTSPPCPNPNPPYSYVPHDEVKPYFNMAKQYVLADEMYASDYDSSSFISHQYIITGRNPESSVDYPDGSWGCSGAPGDVIGILGADRRLPDPGKKNDYEPPCWDPPTLGDELDTAGLDWAFYAVPVSGESPLRPDTGSSRGRGIWSAYQAIKHIYNGPDWGQDVFSPPSKFLNDIGRGSLRAVTWITPTYANSDHGGSGSKAGPSWVSSLVNAVGGSQY
ncbi:MAG TPA: alkaline phosphatase family protein, partial [Candidatus Cybelea sp.]